jgi:hypothetical protein
LAWPVAIGAPGAAALRLAEARMPGDRLVAEAGGEALQERLGERDLGQQDERLASPAKRLGDRLEIDFGLARAGDSVEQEGRELGRLHRLDQPVRRRALGEIELRRVVVRIGEGKGIVDRDFDRLDCAGLDQAANDPVGNVGRQRQLAHQALPLADPLQRLCALRGEPLRDEAGQRDIR